MLPGNPSKLGKQGTSNLTERERGGESYLFARSVPKRFYLLVGGGEKMSIIN